MNIDHLSRCYDQLTPAERLPLIIAAGARGDAVEQKRLSASAPTQKFEVPDYYGHARAWNEAANYHLLTLLDLGMHFWQWWGLWMIRGVRDQAAGSATNVQRGKARAEKAQAIRTGSLVRYYAARFVARVDGWKQFCAESHVDPEVQLKFMIGWDNVVRTESKVQRLRDRCPRGWLGR
jgi:hypothetical protein